MWIYIWKIHVTTFTDDVKRTPGISMPYIGIILLSKRGNKNHNSCNEHTKIVYFCIGFDILYKVVPLIVKVWTGLWHKMIYKWVVFMPIFVLEMHVLPIYLIWNKPLSSLLLPLIFLSDNHILWSSQEGTVSDNK
jgi:hypothetical protein